MWTTLTQTAKNNDDDYSRREAFRCCCSPGWVRWAACSSSASSAIQRADCTWDRAVWFCVSFLRERQQTLGGGGSASGSGEHVRAEVAAVEVAAVEVAEVVAVEVAAVEVAAAVEEVAAVEKQQ